MAYSAGYSTSGSFLCSGQYVLPGSCASVADGITITNGSASATFRFFGASGTLVASTNPSALTPIGIGRIETSFAGSGPFTFPFTQSPNGNPIARLSVTVSVAGSGARIWNSGFLNPSGLIEIPRNCCEGASDDLLYGIEQTPRRPGGSALVIRQFTRPVLSSTSGAVQQLSAVPSVIPEPSTYALLGTGLLSLGGIAALRRKRAEG